MFVKDGTVPHGDGQAIRDDTGTRRRKRLTIYPAAKTIGGTVEGLLRCEDIQKELPSWNSEQT